MATATALAKTSTRDVESRYRETWALAGRLNPARMTQARNAMRELYREAQAKRGARVRVSGEDGEYEWDLLLANKLDSIYRVVADEVKATGRTAAEVASVAGFSMWPLAIAAALFAWSWSTAKRA